MNIGKKHQPSFQTENRKNYSLDYEKKNHGRNLDFEVANKSKLSTDRQNYEFQKKEDKPMKILDEMLQKMKFAKVKAFSKFLS